MPLRPADAYGYAKFRSTLADSDCNAIFRTGENSYQTVPVLIRDGGTECFIETDEYRFVNPEKLHTSNWRRFLNHGGEGGIRTHGGVSPTLAFEASTFNRSVTSPQRQALVILAD